MVWINIRTIARAQERDIHYNRFIRRDVKHGKPEIERWLQSIGGQPGCYERGAIQTSSIDYTFRVDDAPTTTTTTNLDVELESFLALYRGGIPPYVRNHLKTDALSYHGSVEAGHFNVVLIDAYTDADWEAHLSLFRV
jgi:hypothetical protein